MSTHELGFSFGQVDDDPFLVEFAMAFIDYYFLIYLLGFVGDVNDLFWEGHRTDSALVLNDSVHEEMLLLLVGVLFKDEVPHSGFALSLRNGHDFAVHHADNLVLWLH